MAQYCCIINSKKTLLGILIMTVLTKVCRAEPPAKYGPPQPHYHEENYDTHQPKSYEFGYAVKDDYTGNDYGRKETSDGHAVQGEYRVNLPDGRVQIVTYYADWQSGFHADVRYEGEAHYPEVYKQYGYGPAQYGPPQSQAASSY